MSPKKNVLSTYNEHLGDQSGLSCSFNNVSLSKVTLRGQKQKISCLPRVSEDINDQTTSCSPYDQNNISSDGAKVVNSSAVAIVNKINMNNPINKNRKKKSYSLTQSQNSNEICNEDQQPPESESRQLSLCKKPTKKRKRKADQESVFDSVKDTVTSISFCDRKSEPEADNVPVKPRKKKLKEMEVHQTLVSKSGDFDNIRKKLPENSKHRHKKIKENVKKEGLLDLEPVLISNKLLEDITDLELKSMKLLNSKSKNNSKQSCSGSGIVKSRSLCEIKRYVGNDPKPKLSLSLTNKHKQESAVSMWKDQPHNTSFLHLTEDVSCSTKDLVKNSEVTNKHSPSSKHSTKRKSQENSLQNGQVKSCESFIVDETPKKKRKHSSLLIVNQSHDFLPECNDLTFVETHDNEDTLKQLKTLDSSKMSADVDQKLNLNNCHFSKSNLEPTFSQNLNRKKSNQNLFISEEFNDKDEPIDNKKVKVNKIKKSKNKCTSNLDSIQQDSIPEAHITKSSKPVHSNLSMSSMISGCEKIPSAIHGHGDKRLKIKSKKGKIAYETQNKMLINTFDSKKDISTLKVNKSGLVISNALDIDKIKQELLAAAFKSINNPKKDHCPVKSKIKTNHTEPHKSFTKKGKSEVSKSLITTKTNSKIKPRSKALSQDNGNIDFESCKRPRKKELDGNLRKICLPNKMVKLKPKLEKSSNLGIDKLQKELLESAFKKMSTTKPINSQFELNKNVREKRSKGKQKENESINKNLSNLRKSNEGPTKAPSKNKDKMKANDPTTKEKEVLTNNASCSKQVVRKKSEGNNYDTKKKKSKVKTIDPFEEMTSKLLSEELKKRKKVMVSS